MRRELQWALGATAIVVAALTGRYLMAKPADSEPSALARWPSTDELAGLAPYLSEPDEAVRGYVVPDTRIVSDDFFVDDEEPLPAATPGTAAEPAPDVPYRVSAILLADNRRIAIINDSVVAVGDPLPGGATVLQIESDHVVLRSSRGARTVLRF